MFSCRRRVARSYLLGHRELAFEIVVPGGGDVDGVVTAGKGRYVDGAAAHFGVGKYDRVPVIDDIHIIGGVDIIHNSDNTSRIIIIYVWHVSRDVPFQVRFFPFHYYLFCLMIFYIISKSHSRNEQKHD